MIKYPHTVRAQQRLYCR